MKILKINKPIDYNTYEVKLGDSIISISEKFNLTQTSLREMNGLKDEVLYVGQILKVPKVL